MRNLAFVAALALGIVCLPSASTGAQDYTSWIRRSDGRDNTLIAELIREGDLTTGLEIVAAIGTREDAQIQEIILAVGDAAGPRPQWERELILRTLLVSVFPPSLPESELESRLRQNRGGLDFLVGSLPEFTLSLKREVIRLLGFMHPPEYLSVLMSEGRRLAEMLQNQDGMLNGEQAGLTLTFLESVGRIGNPDFAELVLLILERSRHLEVAGAARSVSRSLLLAE